MSDPKQEAIEELAATVRDQYRRIAELEEMLTVEQPCNYCRQYHGKDVCEELLAENKRLKEAPIQILVKGDQMWIAFDAGDHRHAMINLNEIVRNKPDFGITKGICLDAMHKVLEVEN